MEAAEPSRLNGMKYFIAVQEWAKSKNIELFYFSSFDESWKTKQEGKVVAMGRRWGKTYMAGASQGYAQSRDRRSCSNPGNTRRAASRSRSQSLFSFFLSLSTESLLPTTPNVLITWIGQMLWSRN